MKKLRSNYITYRYMYILACFLFSLNWFIGLNTYMRSPPLTSRGQQKLRLPEHRKEHQALKLCFAHFFYNQLGGALYRRKNGRQITNASEKTTVKKVTSEKKNGKEEQNTNRKVRRAQKRNERRTEKSEERKKNGKESAAGEDKMYCMCTKP